MRRQLILLLAVFGVLAGPVSAADVVPGAPQRGPIALTGGTIHPVSGAAIPQGVLVFDKGKITAVGKNVTPPKGADVIDVTGKHVYPGLFEAHSQLGLVEISAVRATRDRSESGELNPNVKARVSVNPDSELIPVTRSNGVLLALTAPSGGLISGQASVLQLDGWTYEDLTLKPGVALAANWPRMSPVFRAKGDDPVKQQEEQRNKSLEKLRDFFEQARAYRKSKSAANSTQRTDVRLESMIAVLEGKRPLLVEADDLSEIQSAVAFAAEFGAKIIILGGYDAPLCATLLKKHDVPVIVSAVHRLPRRRSDDYDAAYTLPARLREAGIKFCISGTDRSSVWNTRNLAYHAATAAAYGLPREDALKSVSLYPAEILGVADRVGSLERGKDATLIITTGDPLETTTQITAGFVQGRKIDLNDRHKRLYRKYQEKYRRK